MLDTDPTVIVRLDRTIQYIAASRSLSGVSGILDPRWSLSSGSPKARPGGGDDESGMAKIWTMRTLQ
jgi:hypothetical protein